MISEIIILILTAAWIGAAIIQVMRGRYPVATLGFGPLALAGAGAAAGAASGLISGYFGKRGAKQQRDAERRAREEELRYNNLATDTALKELAPWRGMEDKARVSMMDILGYNGPDAANSAIDALMKSPAVQFRLKSGQNAIDRSASAGGGLFSGRTGMALAKYGQDLGSQEFENEYGRRKGMMDWSYGNTGTRADLERGRYSTAGAISGRAERNMGGYQAQGTQAWGQGLSSAISGAMSGAKTGMGLYGDYEKFQSLYGDK